MSQNNWHDIDDPGFYKKSSNINDRTSSSSCKSLPTYDFDSSSKTPTNKKNQCIRLSEGKFIPPKDGVGFNEKCKVRVKVEYLDESCKSMKKVTFSLFSIFNGKTDDLSHCADGYEENGFAEAEMTMFYPPDHTGDNQSAEYFFKASHIKGEKEVESERLKIPFNKKMIFIPWIIDCHMHINSGHCSPWPLTKSKVPVPFMNQKRIDWLGEKAMGDFGHLQKYPTDEIGHAAIVASQAIINDREMNYLGDVEKRRRLLVNMPMNMDFAHFRGYEGRPIYENVDGEIKTWNEKSGKYNNVNPVDFYKFENYDVQLYLANKAFLDANGLLVSFYHYDPRANLENWRSPFDNNMIQTASLSNFPRKLPTIGIKMYTALGYKPLDAKLNFPWHEYYGLCEQNQIPIICHGSRGGMTTHDICRYYEREYPANTYVDESFKSTWFSDNFMSPYAWESVLKKHPNLTLCLAHFGGDTFWDEKENSNCKRYWEDLHNLDPENWIAGFLHLMTTYKNFYVDLAYFLFKPSMAVYFKKALEYAPIIKERILFGTDWWLVTKEGKYSENGYGKYVRNLCEGILAINDQELFEKIGVKNANELLAYFMVLNPMRFFQLRKHVDKLAEVFIKDESVKSRSAKFELKEWIDEVPETIEGFYT
jgi:predicted TIM-barrel fold metal-dependent hydrolase